MIINSECLAHMRTMESFSVDFIVTDPPYGLKFMGKKWDYELPSIDIWKEALRICKPGSMMAVFGGSRTHHRLMCSIEDAGWEIRDVVMWLYGSGFPKSHNFGKKMEKEWEGYGTALKPSYEPIILCMAPLDGTFAQNADKWGVGGINIDAGRIGTIPAYIDRPRGPKSDLISQLDGQGTLSSGGKGRWPANSIFDEEAAEALDRMSGVLKSGAFKSHYIINHAGKKFSGLGATTNIEFESNSGGASRFFYCAKASTSERNAGLEGHVWLDKLELVLYNGTSFNLEELWVLEGQNQIMNLDSDQSHEKDISEDLTKLLEDRECCIISCGNKISDQFPKTIKFITSMGSKQIIELKTLDFYLPLSINDCIQDVLKTNSETGISLAENAGLKNILKRIFTKEKIASLLGVKNAAKKMPCLISAKEELRKSNIHATVKPLSLMRYLIKLLAPPGDPLLLDPFAGSGSTLVAAKELGIRAMGIEMNSEYCEIAEKRIAAAVVVDVDNLYHKVIE